MSHAILIAYARVNLSVLEERHEPEVHVELLVAMEECHPRTVSDEVKFELLDSAQHHHVFDHTGSRFAGDARQFKAVPVKVQRMDV